MKYINLTQGKKTIVDDDDYQELIKYKWYASWDRDRFRARRNKYNNGKQTGILMARYIMNCPNNLCVDHINNDSLDNRKSNLRIVNRFQNQQNSKKQCNNLLGHKNIYFEKSSNKYVVQFMSNKVRFYVGRFKSLHQAIIARNTEVKRINNEFARL